MFKAIGRFWKKVGKGIAAGVKKISKSTFGKVAAIALLGVATFFTFGAALGVGALKGGFGAAVKGVVAKMGVKGTMAKVLTGAATGAAKGAAIGGITSKIAGGSFLEGASSGASFGGMVGAAMPGLSKLGGKITGKGAGAKGAGVTSTPASAQANAPLTAQAQPTVDVGLRAGTQVDPMVQKMMGSGALKPSSNLLSEAGLQNFKNNLNLTAAKGLNVNLTPPKETFLQGLKKTITDPSTIIGIGGAIGKGLTQPNYYALRQQELDRISQNYKGIDDYSGVARLREAYGQA